MFRRKRQEKYFKKRAKALKQHLRAFFKSVDPEELHKVRVEIKKINTLITFLRDYCGQKKNSNAFKPVKKIFKRAGLIRTAHVNLQLIEKYHLLNEKFKIEQKQNLVYQTGKFCQKHDDYLSEIKKASWKISGNFRNTHNKFVLQAYEKKQKKLSLLFTSDIPGIKLHRCRKKIKFLLYLHQMLSKRIADKLQVDTNYLRLLEESIGKWHDTVSAIEFLKIKNYSDKTVLNRLEAQAQRALRRVYSKSSGFSEKVRGKA